MRNQRIVILSLSVILGVTLANAGSVQAPGWALSATAADAAATTGADLGGVKAPDWAPIAAATQAAPVGVQAPSFSGSDAAQIPTIAAPAWTNDWAATSQAIATGRLTVASSVDAAGKEGGSASAAQPGGNPFALAVSPMATSAPSGTTANPFELPAAPAAAPASSAQPYELKQAAPAPAAGAADPAAQQGPDLRALRYYASQRNLVRVGAEIRRLKSLYPTWQVPDDLFSPVGGVEEQALWDLFSIGNYAEIRRRIVNMQAANPQWRPSTDLLHKLELGETRARIVAASDAGSWGQVVSEAAASKDMLVCTNMDVMWRVGEALVKTAQLAQGFELYRYILSNCSDPHERLATFQKASLLLPAKGLDALLPLANAEEQASFSSIRFDQLRARMGAVASGEEQSDIDDSELQQFAGYIQSSQSAADATLFGWYLYRLEYYDDAAAWFRAATQISKDPKPLEGYILSLRNLDQKDKALELAYKNVGKAPEIAKIYIEMVAEQLTDRDRDDATVFKADDLKRYQDVVDDAKSPLGAQAIGWYYVDSKDLSGAETWFDKSVQWQPTEGGVVGQAVIAARLKRTGELQTIKATYQAEFPALKDFKVWRKTQKVKYSKASGRLTKKKPKSFFAKLFAG
jgi:hypothetical protein